MEMDRYAYKQVKGLSTYMYKRMCMMNGWLRSLQTENWCMDRRQCGDYRMTEDSELFQEYPEHRQ